MEIKALGKKTVTTPGTLVQIAAAETAVHSFALRANGTNAGLVYIGLSTLTRASYVGVFWVLSPGETFNMTAEKMNEINGASVYIDADTANDFVTGVLLIK